MELSSRVEYALLALLELSNHRSVGRPRNMAEIASLQSIPERYLDQVLMILRRHGLVVSQRGTRGGYTLTRDPSEITLLDIVQAVEGESVSPPSDPAADSTVERMIVRLTWQKTLQVCQTTLSRQTLQDLCQARDTYSGGEA